MKRACYVGALISLLVMGYGIYLHVRPDPTLKVARRAQASLSVQLKSIDSNVIDSLEATAKKQMVREAKARKLLKQQEKQRAITAYMRSLKIGQPIGRIVIPSLGVKAVFIEGAPEDQDALESQLLSNGPTHYRSDYGALPLPGMGRTVAIAGHRTTYGAWFRHIDKLKPGDQIFLLMPYGVYRYSFQKREQVAYNAWSVLNDHGYERLVLTSCDPPGSAAHRLVVFAKLIS